MSKLNPISEERKKERRDKIVNDLKALIFPTIIFALFGLALVFIFTYQKKDTDAEIVPVYAYSGEGKPIVLESSKIKFEMDSLTTNFTVTVKDTGKVWYSYAETGADDAIAIADEKNKLQSSMLITYGNEAGSETTFDSFSYSAANGIYDIEQGDDYVRVNYSLGKVAKEYVCPPVITEKRYKEFVGKMSGMQADTVSQFYVKYDIKKLGKKDNKEELLASYPILETEVIYVRSANKEAAQKTLQGYFEEAGYTYEDYVADKELDNSNSQKDFPVFNVSVIYRLDGDDLVVEVPFDSFESKSNYPIYQISPLPYFGAQDTDKDGFLFIPEGGGSLIRLNNGKNDQSSYYTNVYGWDMAMYRDALVHSTMNNFPVYGVSDGKDSFYCVIEDGSSYASVRADVSGRFSAQNYVNALYTIKAKEKYELGSTSNQDVYVYLEDLPLDESIVSRYRFVNSGSYVDMAKNFQEYLFDKNPGVFTKKTEASVPVLVEAVGAVDKVKQIVGIPVSRPLPLTTYDEASWLIEDMTSKGIDNLSVKYIGWFNGGVKQKYLDNVRLISSLGSKKDLKNLVSTADANNVNLYLDGITNYEYNSNIFNGFFSFTDAAKFLSRKKAELHIFSDVTYAERDGTDPYYLLHADKIIDCANNLTEYTGKLGTGVSFQDIGDDLSSDFQRKHYVSRESAKKSQIEVLANAKTSGQKIMVNSGNDYVLPYASFIANMDLKGSEYTIIDETVPFYQIALHGYVDYSGTPINTSGNVVEEVLTCAEYGAGLNFSFMVESPFTLQKTLYTEYYASSYDAWQGKMMDIYTRYNAELGHTFNQEIVGHKNINDDVSVTEYEDGTKVYVNFGYTDVLAGGVNVPARDYLVVR